VGYISGGRMFQKHSGEDCANCASQGGQWSLEDAVANRDLEEL